jgi:hypothetical protein
VAWRIDENVIRGEIDNRSRGRVVGRLWLVGLPNPVELDLAGNAWRDLAGRRLEFVNPAPKPPTLPLEDFAPRQTGVIGDCTASRKVKVPDVSMEEFGKLYAQRKPFPWHWGNSVYFEWFSERNGRVVIESADYQLTLSTDGAWDMTPDEEEAQRQANAAALTEFMAALASAKPAEDPAKAAPVLEDPDWETTRPQTEEEAERAQADSDKLADRIQARLDREGPGANYEKILEEELERQARERGDDAPLTPEEEAKRAEWIDEMNRASEEALANPDPEREAELNRVHPLAERAQQLTLRLMDETEEHGWIPEDASREHPVAVLVASVMSAGAKFAGALNGEDWPPPVDFCAQNIVRLKRARSYLDDALLAADSCTEQNLTEPGWLEQTRRELQALGEECDALIAELRGRLERGFD